MNNFSNMVTKKIKMYLSIGFAAFLISSVIGPMIDYFLSHKSLIYELILTKSNAFDSLIFAIVLLLIVHFLISKKMEQND